MIIALIALMSFFQIVTGGILLKPLNITNLILQNSYVLILAIGMLLVIVAFSIDLSVGSVVGFVGAIAGVLIVTSHVPVIVAVLIALLIGALVGAWQGFWIAYFKIPGFIVTLAGMLIFRGLTMTVLNGQSIGPFPESFQKISTGFLPDLFGGQGMHLTTILIGLVCTAIYIAMQIRDRKIRISHGFEVLPMGLLIGKVALIALVINAFSIALAQYRGIPNIMALLALLIGIYVFITTKTVAGRHIYALGGNAKAAQLSGINTKKVTFWVFVNMGALSALSGLVFAARLNAATPTAGTSFELDAIAACFIGGASTAGGIGTVSGAIVGALFMGVLNNGMSLLGVGSDWQQTIKGLVLLLAVAFDVFTKARAKTSH